MIFLTVGTLISSRTSSPSCQTAMTFCWAASRWWKICRAHGSCWSIVQLLAPISFCCLSVLGESPLSLLTTMTRCGHACARCSVLIPQASLTLPGLVPPSRFGPQQRFELAICGSLGKLGGLIAFGWFTRGTPSWPAPSLKLLRPMTLPRRLKVSFQHRFVARCGFRDPILGRSNQGRIQSRFSGGRGPIPATFRTSEGCCCCRA